MDSKDIVILGLGSNVGNTRKNILNAFKKLPLKKKRISSIMKTKALLTRDAPQEWDQAYDNAVVIGKALFGPFETLACLKKIEKQMKRIKRGKYSPRTLDVDILFWGNTIVLEKQLRVPHKEVLKRNFTLEPLSELVPMLLHPIYKITVRQALLNYYRNLKKNSVFKNF